MALFKCDMTTIDEAAMLAKYLAPSPWTGAVALMENHGNSVVPDLTSYFTVECLSLWLYLRSLWVWETPTSLQLSLI